MKTSITVLWFTLLAALLVCAPASANDDPTSDAVKRGMDLKDILAQVRRKMKYVDQPKRGGGTTGTTSTTTSSTSERDVEGRARRELKSKKTPVAAPTFPPKTALPTITTPAPIF